MGQYEGPNITEEITPSPNRFLLVKKLLQDFSSKAYPVERKIYAILGGSGMGKSSFSASLFYQYVQQFKFKKPKLSFFIQYLGTDDVLTKIRLFNRIAEEKDSVILLDALDENIQATKDCHSFLESLIAETNNFKYIIITSRTQLFLSAIYEPDNTIYISPFTKEEAQRHLAYKYRNDSEKKKQAIDITENSSDLMSRPMILSFIDDLININNLNLLSKAELYHYIIDAWLTRECNTKISSDYCLTKEELFVFSKQLAFFIYKKWTKKSESIISPIEYIDFIQDNGYKNNPYSFKGRSLINRDADGNIKFSHKSFFEFFIAVISSEQPWLPINPDGLDGAVQFAKELNRSYLYEKTQNLSYVEFYKPSFFVNLDFDNKPIKYDYAYTNINTISPLKNSLNSIWEDLTKISSLPSSSLDNSDYTDNILCDFFVLWELYLKRLPLLIQLFIFSQDLLNKVHKLSVTEGNNTQADLFSEHITNMEKAFNQLFSLSLDFQDIFCGEEKSFLIKLNIIKLTIEKFKNILHCLSLSKVLAEYNEITITHKETVISKHLFDLEEFIIHKILLNKYLFIGGGFIHEDEVFKLINDIVVKKKETNIICILRDETDVDTHVSYIKNLILKVKNKPLLIILIIPYNGKTIYYTIAKSSIIEEDQIRSYFECISTIYPSTRNI